MPTACEPEVPWLCSVGRSTPTPSASSAAGNLVPCSDIYMPRLSPSSETWLPPCLHMVTSLSSLGPMVLHTLPPSQTTSNSFQFPPTCLCRWPSTGALEDWMVGVTIVKLVLPTLPTTPSHRYLHTRTPT